MTWVGKEPRQSEIKGSGKGKQRQRKKSAPETSMRLLLASGLYSAPDSLLMSALPSVYVSQERACTLERVLQLSPAEPDGQPFSVTRGSLSRVVF